MTRALLLLGLLACTAAPVRMTGRVSASREDPVALAGASVAVFDGVFEEVGRATTEADGTFDVQVPRQAEIHVVVDADGAVPAAFRGESGSLDTFEVPDGTLWAVPEAEVASWTSRFAGCPGATEGATLVVGQLRLAISVEDLGTAGIASQGFAFVSSVDDPAVDRRDACYLDAAGERLDPEADVAGPTGRFAIFGVEGGPWSLTLGRFVSGGTAVGRRTLYVPAHGVVSLHPALVPL